MTRAWAAAAAGLVLAFAGCGDDEGDALSAEDYRAQVTKLCQDQNKAEDGLGEPASPSKEDLVAFFDKALDVQKRTTEQFADLEPPEDLAAKHEEVEKLDQEGTKLIEDARDRIEKGEDPQKVIQSIEAEGQRISTRGDQLADEVGVPACKD
jgi:hypothetical protein